MFFLLIYQKGKEIEKSVACNAQRSRW